MLSLFRRRPPEPEFPQFARPDRRAVFRFFDGTSDRVADPIATMRALHRTEANLERDPAAADDGDHDATERLVNAVRDAFRVDPYWEFNGDRGGLTDGECLALLLTFSAYTDALKKNTEPPAT